MSKDWKFGKNAFDKHKALGWKKNVWGV